MNPAHKPNSPRVAGSTYELLRAWDLAAIASAASTDSEPRPGALPIDHHRDDDATAGDPPNSRRFCYIVEQGVLLKKVSNRVVVFREKRILAEIPMLKLEGLLLYGNIQISTQCMRTLMEEEIRVSFFTRQGTFKGSLQGPMAEMASLRLRQYRCSEDPEFCLRFARSVVRGKLLSQRAIAAAYARDAVADSLSEDFRQLDQAISRVASVESLDELRGVEGSASRGYFNLFKGWNRSEFDFSGREKRGSNDPVNILLNLGYTLLTRELSGLAEAGGLDPAIGFYHRPHGNRPSLACDWVEEFRHSAVDRIVLSVLNRRVIQAKDFVDQGDRGRRLGYEGMKKFLASYEKAMLGKGYRETMLRQLGLLLDVIRGNAPEYRTHLEGAPCSLVEEPGGF
jgi:CRISPR-associated protein Cas1